MKVNEPFQCILGIALTDGTKPALFVKKLSDRTQYGTEFFLDAIKALPPLTVMKDRFLVVEILTPDMHHKKLEHDFSFKEIEVITLVDGDIIHKPVVTSDIRSLINDLSSVFSGKTFTEVDFGNAVSLQMQASRDDNRNQDECYNDASVTILYLFLYGFLHDVLSTVNTDISNLWYNTPLVDVGVE